MVAIKKSYRRYGEGKLVTFATTFTSNLTSSIGAFPAPPVNELAMHTAIQEFQTAAENWRAEKSDYNAGVTRNAKADLVAALDSNIDYVEGLATSEDAVRALGLEPVATAPKKAPLPGKPTGEGSKESGEPLSVKVFCWAIKLENSSAQVNYYVYETNEAGTEERRLMYSGSNSRKLEFGGLETGKIYHFYIRAKTTAGFGPPSRSIRWVGR